jgi:hypothetical protein
MWVGGQRYAQAALLLGNKSDTYFIEGWVGATICLDRCEKVSPQSGLDPGSYNL